MDRALSECIGVCIKPVSMRPNPHSLSSIRLYAQRVPSAFRSTVSRLTILDGWVVPHHEIAVVPEGSVIVDVREVHHFQVLFETNVEQAIIPHWNLSVYHVFE